MTDRETWLGLTTEAAIEPGLLICDPHHHLWDYPGSRYLVDEFAADIGGGHQVVKTVFVECRQFYLSDGPVELRPVGETLFVDSVAGPAQTTCGVCDVAAGIVGFADLSLGSPVQGVLDAHMEASTRFRGVRHASAWHESERIHNAHTNPPRYLLGERLFREGLACLEERGLSFDAWLYHPPLSSTDSGTDRPGTGVSRSQHCAQSHRWPAGYWALFRSGRRSIQDMEQRHGGTRELSKRVSQAGWFDHVAERFRLAQA